MGERSDRADADRLARLAAGRPRAGTDEPGDPLRTACAPARRRALAGLIGLATLPAFAAQSPVAAQGFFRGRTLTLTFHGNAGGTNARHARMIAPYLARHAGAADVRVIHAEGTALAGAALLWGARPDGLTIGLTSVSGLALATHAGGSPPPFDPTRFTYIGRVTNEPRVLTVAAASRFRGVSDIVRLGRPFSYPSRGFDEDAHIIAVVADAVGFPLRGVTGYDAVADASAAVVKGEVDGHVTSVSQSLGAIRAGEKRAVLVIGGARVPEWPDVPTLMEVTRTERLARARALVLLADMHRSLLGPPDMQPRPANGLRTALQALLRDPDLRAEASRNQMPLVAAEAPAQQQAFESAMRSAAILAASLGGGPRPSRG